MRFIHTADWHLGNKFHELDRTLEFKAFLQWLKTQIDELEAEALVIAGDIFDVTNPSNEAQSMFYTFLASLQSSCCKNIIIVAGNHDSAQKIEIARELASLMNIHIVGSINNTKIEDMVFLLNDSDGKPGAVCCAVPFVREVELQDYVSKGELALSDFSDDAYGNLYKEFFNHAQKLRGKKKIPVIATGHLYAADLEGRLSQSGPSVKTDDGVKVLDVIGNLGSVHQEIFPKDFDYVALGHIHYTTTVGKNPRIRYSGSPFVLGFDEASISRNILCVDCDYPEKDRALSEPVVKKIPVPQFVHFKRLTGTKEEIEDSLSKFEKENFSEPVYLELCYKRDPVHDVREELEEKCDSLPENVSVISWKPLENNSDTGNISFNEYESDELKNISEEKIFTSLILNKLKLDEESVEGKKAIETFLPLFLDISSKLDLSENQEEQ